MTLSSLWTKDWDHESRKLFFPKVIVPCDPQILSNILQFLFFWTPLLFWVPLIALAFWEFLPHGIHAAPPRFSLYPLLPFLHLCCCLLFVSLPFQSWCPQEAPSWLYILLEWSYLGGHSAWVPRSRDYLEVSPGGESTGGRESEKKGRRPCWVP